MDFDIFTKKLFEEAKNSNIEHAEVYYLTGENFSASSMDEKIIDYSANSTHGLSLRGIYQGKMGYSSTQILDEDAVSFLIKGLIESAVLNENPDHEDIFPGEDSYPKVDTFYPPLAEVTEEEKLKKLLDMERSAKKARKEIKQVSHNSVGTASTAVRIANTYGLDIGFKANMLYGYTVPVARDEDKVATAMGIALGKSFDELELDRIAEKAADQAVFMLDAKPLPAGKYNIVFTNETMAELISVFSSSFSAEMAQKGLSLLKDKENQKIAASCITIKDDPLLPMGRNSRPFDDEGVKCQKKDLVTEGILQTLLHNRKTAKKANTKSTGNGIKASYASPVEVKPTNLYIAPTRNSFSKLLEKAGEGIVITELMGLHSGANPISGDFSLSAKGYTFKEGKKESPVAGITVAGNFYSLLKSIMAVGDDLWFTTGSSVGSPSAFVGEMTISGS